MSDAPVDDADAPTDTDIEEPDRKGVEQERSRIRKFINDLSPDELTSGAWFTRLFAKAMDSYSKKATWQYFQEKYAGVPADAIVEMRIKIAARYAQIEGALSASAYSAAIVYGLGERSGPSKTAAPAGAVSGMVDLAFITRLQLCLAYDVSVLYRVPLDLSDPEDMWKLIKVALTIRSGEVAREAVTKGVPAVVRPLIKRYYSKEVLTAARSLPIVGKHLAQRNVVKFGIPVVGVPLTIALNRYTTLIAGRYARDVFRNEARVIEIAQTLTRRSQHPKLMLWVAWLVVMADAKISDDEALLMRHLTRLVREQHEINDEELARLIETDQSEVLRRIDAEPDDLSDILDAANRVALVDGDLGTEEKQLLAELEGHCKRD